MMDIENLVRGLISPDNKYAFECLKLLESESNISPTVYPYFDFFAELLNNENSYIRTRGIVLIAANAKWDADNKIDEIIGQYLKHITDEKPITVRQCIKVLPLIAKYKPDLKDCVLTALQRVNTFRYKESMQSLVLKDIQMAVSVINKL